MNLMVTLNGKEQIKTKSLRVATGSVADLGNLKDLEIGDTVSVFDLTADKELERWAQTTEGYLRIL